MTPAETAEDRDARLEKLALERDRAVELLRRFEMNHEPENDADYECDWISCPIVDVRKFLESLT